MIRWELMQFSGNPDRSVLGKEHLGGVEASVDLGDQGILGSMLCGKMDCGVVVFGKNQLILCIILQLRRKLSQL
jgi:hypothetical protein